MGNLDFNALGVQEMNEAELQNVDGGGLWDSIVEIEKAKWNFVAEVAGAFCAGFQNGLK